MGDLVAVVRMKESSVHDGVTQIKAVARVVVQIDAQCNDLASFGEAHL